MAGDFQFALDFSSKRPPLVQEKIAEGMKQADDNANSQWRHIFDGCVLAAARKKEFITSDDVLTELEALPDPPETYNQSAIGPAMQRAQKMGLLEYTNEVRRSERPTKHGNRQNLWKSKVFKRG